MIPLAEVRDRVAADWTAARTAEALTKLADGYAAELQGGPELRRRSPSGSAARSQAAGPLTRGETRRGAPPELVADVFAADAGGAGHPPRRRRRDPGASSRAIEAFDPATEAERADPRQPARPVPRPGAPTTCWRSTPRRCATQAGVQVNQAQIEATLARFP